MQAYREKKTTYRLLVGLNMVAHSSLSDNLNMNFDALVEMGNQVHFWDLENLNLVHLVRQNVDSCLEYRRI